MPKDAKKTAKPGEAERAAVRELVKAARARGDCLMGPEGLLTTITATAAQAGVAGVAGLLLSYHFDTPSGPTIIGCAGALYAVSLLVAPGGGLLRGWARSYRSA